MPSCNPLQSHILIKSMLNPVLLLTTYSAGAKTLIESNVQNLVNAMSSFAPPAAGQTTLPQNCQDALASVIAANWQ